MVGSYVGSHRIDGSYGILPFGFFFFFFLSGINLDKIIHLNSQVQQVIRSPIMN